MRLAAFALALAFATPALAVDLIPSHVQAVITTALPMKIDAVLWQATTTAYVDDQKRVVTIRSDAGSAAAPTLGTDGISLDGVAAIQVVLQTGATATGAATGMACWWLNPDVGIWAPLAGWNLTTVAATIQTWAPTQTLMRKGRISWVATGAGSVTSVVTMTAQPVQPGTAAP